jgi:hypothetical protein
MDVKGRTLVAVFAGAAMFYACSNGASQSDAGADAAMDATMDAITVDRAADVPACSNEGGTEQSCNGQCVDTASDPVNCGGCGMACDFTCVASHCGPVVTLTNADAVDIAVDSTSVYWREYGLAGQIAVCPLSGCVSGTIVAPIPNSPRPGLAVTGSTLYWIDSASINQCPKSGCTTAALFVNDPSAVALATDASFLYWTSSATKTVNKCSLAGCTTPTVLATSTHVPGMLVVDGSVVVWADADGVVESCSTNGCGTPSLVYWSEGVAGLAASNGEIALFSTLNTALPYTLFSLLEDGSAIDGGLYVTGEPSPENLVTDGIAAYWANWSASDMGTLKKCALDGGSATPTLLLGSRNFGDPTTTALKVTATSMIWIEAGSIWKHAK